MTLSVSLEMDGQGVVFTFNGVLKGDEIYSASQQLYTDANLRRLRYQIVDLTRVSRIEISTRQIQALAELDCQAATFAGGFFVASVVSHDLQESISQFYRAYLECSAIDAKIFRTLTMARNWVQEKMGNTQIQIA